MTVPWNVLASLPSPVVVGLAAATTALAAVPIRPRYRRTVATGTVRTVGSARLEEAAGWMHDRRARRPPTAAAVADWCDDVVRHTRSGSSLRDAVATMPTDPATARATAPMRLAVDRGTSVSDATDRVQDAGPHLRLALAVIATASRIGGPSAAAIDRTAVVLRERAADLDERTAHTAQARLSAHVMTAVPLLTLAMLTATDGAVRSVVASPSGTLCLGAGLGVNAAGWWWMRRIIGVPS
jgi:Flp pilus assembly protein TadB